MLDINNSLDRFINQHMNIEHGRYKSWEHCYSCFAKSRKKCKPDYQYLSLVLAFYLASWGMYRGSTFLIKRDYLIHKPAVEIIMKRKYDNLLGIDCCHYSDKSKVELLFNLAESLKEYYKDIRDKTKANSTKSEISETLITKVLMGTLGCVPAYDKYFVLGCKEIGASGKFNEKSIKELCNLYSDNKNMLEEKRKELLIDKTVYPQMKLIDMALWQLGLDLEEEKT